MSYTVRGIESNSITGDTQLGGGPVVVYAISLCGGSDSATLTLYDNTSAAGEVEWKLAATAGTTTSINFGDRPIRFNTACYADISGTAARASIAFE